MPQIKKISLFLSHRSYGIICIHLHELIRSKTSCYLGFVLDIPIILQRVALEKQRTKFLSWNFLRNQAYFLKLPPVYKSDSI